MPNIAPYTTTRLLSAPRRLVFDVHTKPEHLAQWLSPPGFQVIHAKMSFVVGGTYHYGLEGPNGMQMWGKQTFREIVPNERLVYIQSFSDKDGGVTRHPASPQWPLEMLATLIFEDAGENKTKLTLSWLPHKADEAENQVFDAARESMDDGFGGMFDNLDIYLAKLQA
jgi:uncharacterized protein YndB with AHSA1/START domain